MIEKYLLLFLSSVFLTHFFFSSLLFFSPTEAISHHPLTSLVSVNAVLKRTYAVASTVENIHHLGSSDASPTLTAEYVLHLASGHVPEMGGLVPNTCVCLKLLLHCIVLNKKCEICCSLFYDFDCVGCSLLYNLHSLSTKILNMYSTDAKVITCLKITLYIILYVKKGYSKL